MAAAAEAEVVEFEPRKITNADISPSNQMIVHGFCRAILTETDLSALFSINVQGLILWFYAKPMQMTVSYGRDTPCILLCPAQADWKAVIAKMKQLFDKGPFHGTNNLWNSKMNFQWKVRTGNMWTTISEAV